MAKQVLIVENSAEFRELLEEIVVGLGYEAIAVDRATTALKTLSDSIVSLILLDVKMPKVHGDDFLRFIRKRGNRVPVVVVSAYLTPEVLERLRDQGVRHVIAKPFKVQRVAQVVTSYLEEAA